MSTVIDADEKLVRELEIRPLTLVVAALGRRTRPSMIRWALDGRESPVVVTPIALHPVCLRDAGEDASRLRLYSPHQLRDGGPPPTDRTMVENNTLTPTIERYMHKCVRFHIRASLRLFEPPSQTSRHRLMAMGFAFVVYDLATGDDSIRVYVN